MESDNRLLDEFVLSLVDVSSPRVCFLPTASGDAEGYVARFTVCSPRWTAAHGPPALQSHRGGPGAFVLAQDIV